MTSQRIPLFVSLVAAASISACNPSSPSRFDLIVRGGEVVDGTGQAPRRADVGIKGDRITSVGDLAGQQAGRVIDATGLMVAPGFIDVQGQSGTTLLANGNGESHIRQGITTEIIGEGGTPALWTKENADDTSIQRFKLRFDWSGFDGYLRGLEKKGTSINLGSFVPVAMLREQVLGMADRSATPQEVQREAQILERAMQQGAFGFATALIYPPASYTNTDELIALAKVAAKYNGVYISHVRGESFRLKEAIGEAIRIGEEAHLPVVIYHLKIAA